MVRLTKALIPQAIGWPDEQLVKPAAGGMWIPKYKSEMGGVARSGINPQRRAASVV